MKRDHIHVNTAIFNRTTPTIPSKFETTLHTDVRERKGFLSNSFRFQANYEYHDNYSKPGPGQYTPVIEKNTSEESFSKKGYGGFASQTKRFAENRNPRYGLPGPARYQLETTSFKELDPFNKLIKTSSFASRVERILPQVTDVNSGDYPGPAEYDVEKTKMTYHTQNNTIDKFSTKFGKERSFLTTSDRFDKSENGIPGPSEYNVDKDVENIGKITGALSSFKSKSIRKINDIEIINTQNTSIDSNCYLPDPIAMRRIKMAQESSSNNNNNNNNNSNNNTSNSHIIGRFGESETKEMMKKIRKGTQFHSENDDNTVIDNSFQDSGRPDTNHNDGGPGPGDYFPEGLTTADGGYLTSSHNLADNLKGIFSKEERFKEKISPFKNLPHCYTTSSPEKKSHHINLGNNLENYNRNDFSINNNKTLNNSNNSRELWMP